MKILNILLWNYIFLLISIQKTIASIVIKIQTDFLFDFVMLIESLPSGFIVVSSNPCVGPLPRTKLSFSYYQYAR